MDIPLLTTKVSLPLPRASDQLISRPRLIEQLDAGFQKGNKLTLISAPAGFGKTTLLSNWAHYRKERVAWLTLDERDNDPTGFWNYAITALRMVEPNISETAQILLNTMQPQATPIEVVLTTLINELAAVSTSQEPLFLVLDDYHLIESQPIHLGLNFWLEHLPPTLHLIISGRSDPPLPLARLRVRGQMLELREAELRFTAEEAASFLNRIMNLNLSEKDLATLERRTEGWIAGLQMAALSMRGRDDLGSFIQAFGGSHRYVIDYLSEEVLKQQPEEIRSFLTQVAILDQLSAPLCDAVTQRDNSKSILAELERTNLFLVPLDDRREWFRFHRLFRDLLRAQGEAEEQVLHQRAASWYQANGLLDEAVKHALAAADWDQAEKMIGPAAAEAIRNGQLTTLHHWLTAIPNDIANQKYTFAVFKGWASFVTGQVPTAVAHAELAAELMPADAPAADRAVLDTLRSYLALAQNDPAKTITLVTETLELLKDQDPYFFRGALLSNLAQAQTLMGDLPSATQTFRQMIDISQTISHPLTTVSALANLAWFLHIQGKRTEAITLAQQALEHCIDSQGRRLALASAPHIILGAIYYEMDELDLAHQHIVQGAKLGEKLGPAGGEITGKVALAGIQQALGEEQTALATVEELRQLATQFNLPQVIMMAAGVEAEIMLTQGNLAVAERWAGTSGISPTDTPNHLRETDYFTYARLLLAQKRLDDADTLLGNFEQFASAGKRQLSLIRVHLLQARVQQAQGQQKAFLAYLEKALRLAAPEGYVRVFLDDGRPLFELLPKLRHVAPNLVDRLLDSEPKQLKPEQPLIEPLSERELEVLRLIAAGLSNREIAERLFIGIGTVKTHAHNIYGKLEVNGRPKAIARARELGLA